MPDEHPDTPTEPSGPPPSPGSAPPPYPGSPSEGPSDPWYRPAPPPPPQGGYPPPGGGYFPPNAPPYGGQGPGDGPWGQSYGYGPQGAPGAAPFASYWARVGGFLLDAVILFVVSLIYLVPSHAFEGAMTMNNGVQTRAGVSPGGYVVLLIVGALYAGLLIGLRGQTVGMMAARIKAVDAATGGVIGFWRAIGRDLFERLLGVLFVLPLLVDLLFPAWDPRRQTLHDKITNTVVIKV